MDGVVERWESEGSLLSAQGIRDLTAEEIADRSFVKPSIELQVGDMVVFDANGEKSVAVVTEIYGDHLVISYTRFMCRIVMPDGTLGRDRMRTSPNAGFVTCFMVEQDPAWFDVEYEELCLNT